MDRHLKYYKCYDVRIIIMIIVPRIYCPLYFKICQDSQTSPKGWNLKGGGGSLNLKGGSLILWDSMTEHL